MALLLLQQTGDVSGLAASAFGTGQTLGSGAVNRVLARSGAGASSEDSFTVAAGTTAIYFETTTDALGWVDWGAGTYTVRLNVTTANMWVNWVAAYLVRLNAAGAVQSTVGSLTGQTVSLGTAGVLTMDVTGSAQAASATDRLAVVYVFQNTNAMASQAVGVTANVTVSTPLETDVFTQSAYRWRADDGSETTATWLAGANTAGAVATAGSVVRVRTELVNDANTSVSAGFTLQYRLNGGTWTAVPASGGFHYRDSAQLTDAGATTQQLGAGAFSAGLVYESAHAATVTLAALARTELEASLELDAGAADGDVYEFRWLETTGAAAGTYTVTPTATVSGPQLAQGDYRWREDDGSETTATWRQAVNTPDTAKEGYGRRLRTVISETLGVATTDAYKLQYLDPTYAGSTTASSYGGTWNGTTSGFLTTDDIGVVTTVTSTGGARLSSCTFIIRSLSAVTMRVDATSTLNGAVVGSSSSVVISGDYATRTFSFPTLPEVPAGDLYLRLVLESGTRGDIDVPYMTSSSYRAIYQPNATGDWIEFSNLSYVGSVAYYGRAFADVGAPYTFSTPFTYTESTSGLVDAGATTQQLSAGSFVAGRIYESAHSSTTTVPGNTATELEAVLVTIAGQFTLGKTYQFRWVRSDGTALDSYGALPALTAVVDPIDALVDAFGGDDGWWDLYELHTGLGSAAISGGALRLTVTTDAVNTVGQAIVRSLPGYDARAGSASLELEAGQTIASGASFMFRLVDMALGTSTVTLKYEGATGLLSMTASGAAGSVSTTLAGCPRYLQLAETTNGVSPYTYEGRYSDDGLTWTTLGVRSTSTVNPSGVWVEFEHLQANVTATNTIAVASYNFVSERTLRADAALQGPLLSDAEDDFDALDTALWDTDELPPASGSIAVADSTLVFATGAPGDLLRLGSRAVDWWFDEFQLSIPTYSYTGVDSSVVVALGPNAGGTAQVGSPSLVSIALLADQVLILDRHAGTTTPIGDAETYSAAAHFRFKLHWEVNELVISKGTDANVWTEMARYTPAWYASRVGGFQIEVTADPAAGGSVTAAIDDLNLPRSTAGTRTKTAAADGVLQESSAHTTAADAVLAVVAPTVVVRYVNTNSTAGGDGTTNATVGASRAYASLAEAQAAELSVRADLVSRNEQLRFECAGTVADTGVTWSGWTTDATHYLLVVGDNDTGRWDDARYHVVTSNTTPGSLNTDCNHIRHQRMQWRYSRTTGTTGLEVVRASARTAVSTDIRYESCLLRCDSIDASVTGLTTGFSPRLRDSGQLVAFINCVAWGFNAANAGAHAFRCNDGSVVDAVHVYYNCTAYDSENCFVTGSAAAPISRYKNCLAQPSAGGAGYSSSPHADSTNNLSSTSSAPGSNAVVNTTVSFVDAAAGDFHLAASLGGGTSLASDPLAAFDTDIDGVLRAGTWDIGADQFQLVVAHTLLASAGLWQRGACTLAGAAHLVARAPRSTAADAVLVATQTSTLAAEAVLQEEVRSTAALDAVLRGTTVHATAADAVLQHTGVGLAAAADAVLQQTQTAALTVEALLAAAVGLTLVPDAVLTASSSLTLSGAAVLQRVAVVTLHSDALVQARRSATLGTDAVVQWRGAHTVAADAWLRATLGQVLVSEAVLRATRAPALSADARLQAAAQHVLASDAVLRGATSVGTAGDAVLQTTGLALLAVDALVQRTAAATVAPDAVLQAVGSATLLGDAVLRGPRSASLVATAVLRGGTTQTVGADVVLRRTTHALAIADAVLRRTEVAVLGGEAVLRAAGARTLVPDAVLVGGNVLGTAASAVLRGRTTTAIALDAVLQHTRAVSCGSDAIVRATGVTLLVAEGVLRGTGSASAAGSAVLQATGAHTMGAEATLRRVAVATAAADAELLGVGERTVALDAVLRGTTAATLGSDAVLHRTATSTLGADAWLQRTASRPVALDAVLRAPATLEVAGAAVLQRAAARALTSDAVLQQPVAHVLGADAVVVGEGATVSLAGNAVLQATVTAVLAADAILATGQQVQAGADAELIYVRALTFAATARLKYQRPKLIRVGLTNLQARFGRTE